MESRYKRLGKNTIFVFIGRAGSSLIGMIMLPFYTHWLTPEQYGVTDLVTTYAMVLLGFVSCCISDSIFIYPNKADEPGRSRYFSSGILFFGTMSLICILLIILFQWLDIESLKENTFVKRIWFIFVMMTSQFALNYTQSFARSIDKMKIYSIGGVLQTLSIAVLALGLIPKWGLDGYLWSLILSNYISALFVFLLTKSYNYCHLSSFHKQSLRELLSYGIPLIPNGIMWWLINGLNRPVMEGFLGLSALGIFAVSNKFPSILSTLVSIFNAAWSISVLEEFGKADFNRFFNKTLKLLFFFMLIGGCVLASCSKFIIRILASHEFLSAWKYIPMLTIGVIMQNMSGLIGGVFTAEKKSKYFFYSSIWGGLSSVVATFLFTKYWGLQGTAIAVAFSFFVMAIVRLIYAWKYINEFNLTYYGIMLILYVSYNIVVIYDAPMYVNLPTYIFIISVMCIINKNMIKVLWGKAISKIKQI